MLVQARSSDTGFFKSIAPRAGMSSQLGARHSSKALIFITTTLGLTKFSGVRVNIISLVKYGRSLHYRCSFVGNNMISNAITFLSLHVRPRRSIAELARMAGPAH